MKGGAAGPSTFHGSFRAQAQAQHNVHSYASQSSSHLPPAAFAAAAASGTTPQPQPIPPHLWSGQYASQAAEQSNSGPQTQIRLPEAQMSLSQAPGPQLDVRQQVPSQSRPHGWTAASAHPQSQSTLSFRPAQQLNQRQSRPAQTPPTQPQSQSHTVPPTQTNHSRPTSAQPQNQQTHLNPRAPQTRPSIPPAQFTPQQRGAQPSGSASETSQRPQTKENQSSQSESKVCPRRIIILCHHNIA